MASASQLSIVRDRIRELLVDCEYYRDCDRALLFRVWRENGIHVWMSDDAKWVSPETIRRARQIVQEQNPELASSKKVMERRKANREDFMNVIMKVSG